MPCFKHIAGFKVVLGVVCGVYNHTLGEFFNFGLFLVRHFAALKQKLEWFNFEVNRYATEICVNVQENHDYINITIF